jgi:hypothetical protein
MKGDLTNSSSLRKLLACTRTHQDKLLYMNTLVKKGWQSLKIPEEISQDKGDKSNYPP